jgi:hypothetical protein
MISRRLVPDTRAATAAEFALVLPLPLLLIFGIIDGGRFMWEYNRAEKATQMGARYAVATDLVPAGLSTYSFAVSDGIPQGSPVPLANFNFAVCNNANCGTCTGSVCGSIGYNGGAFANIVTRMAHMYPPIGATNVQLEYRNIGLGYAGDPNGPDVAPLVTVRLQGLTFHPITCMLFACSVAMPDFRAALTLEDGAGTVSN